MDFASSCNGLPFNHIYKPGPVLIAQGSRTVTINGMPMARLEMQLECGAKIKTGSENVTVGGPTATVVEINDNEHLVETALQVVGFVALGAAGLGALAAGALAFGGFAAITAGSFFGMNALHDWGESLGPGYGDIMVGVAGFALLGLGAKATETEAGKSAIDVLNRTEVTTEGLGSNLGNVRVGLRPAEVDGATRTGSIDYGSLDSLGRPTGVKATITKDMINTGTPANPDIKPPGWSGNGTANNEARGHLLGRQLGGSGDVPENLVTLEQNPTNSPVMRGFESQVRAAVENGEIVDYSSTPVYGGDNLVPRAITLEATGSDGYSLGVSVLNPKGL